jgi:hypothetical protein
MALFMRYFPAAETMYGIKYLSKNYYFFFYCANYLAEKFVEPVKMKIDYICELAVTIRTDSTYGQEQNNRNN